jgi:hypothetical protein
VGIVVRFVEEQGLCIGHKKRHREQQDAKRKESNKRASGHGGNLVEMPCQG